MIKTGAVSSGFSHVEERDVRSGFGPTNVGFGAIDENPMAIMNRR